MTLRSLSSKLFGLFFQLSASLMWAMWLSVVLLLPLGKSKILVSFSDYLFVNTT